MPMAVSLSQQRVEKEARVLAARLWGGALDELELPLARMPAPIAFVQIEAGAADLPLGDLWRYTKRLRLRHHLTVLCLRLGDRRVEIHEHRGHWKRPSGRRSSAVEGS